MRQRARQEHFVLLYLLPLLAVIVYTVVRHAGYGFEKQAGHWVMDPFFKDHTSYGAVLAMFWFPVLALLLKPNRQAIGKLGIGRGLCGAHFGARPVLYARGLGVVGGGGGLGLVLMRLGVKLRTLMAGCQCSGRQLCCCCPGTSC